MFHAEVFADMQSGAKGLATLLLLTAVACAPATRTPVGPADGAIPVLWRASNSAPTRSAPPRPPFRFVAEDFEGVSPKFTVVDAMNTEWRVKLGIEVHTEIPAGVLLGATGFFVEEMHYIDEAQISGIEALKRGREFVDAQGKVHKAQFEARPSEIQRGETWDWADNPFVGTDPFDGLRVLMLLINNYDARTANNRILEVATADREREARYVVSDLGASFGRYGGMGGRRSKGDLDDYRQSRFIEGVRGDEVLFAYRTRPEGLGTVMFVLNPFYTIGQLKKQNDLNRVPLSGVRWIVQRLQQLPPGTIKSAFDGAGLEPAAAAGFAAVVEERIRALAAL